MKNQNRVFTGIDVSGLSSKERSRQRYEAEKAERIAARIAKAVEDTKAKAEEKVANEIAALVQSATICMPTSYHLQSEAVKKIQEFLASRRFSPANLDFVKSKFGLNNEKLQDVVVCAVLQYLLDYKKSATLKTVKDGSPLPDETFCPHCAAKVKREQFEKHVTKGCVGMKLEKKLQERKANGLATMVRGNILTKEEIEAQNRQIGFGRKSTPSPANGFHN